MRVVRGSSSHSALNASEAGSESISPDSQTQERFTWTGRDISDAGWIAMVLGVARKVEHGEAIIESSVELQCRPPRLTDAWRFFHAAALLQQSGSPHAGWLQVRARTMGVRIALAATGWMVLDMCLAESGNSAGFGLYVQGREQPVIAEIIDADGLTRVEQVQRDYPRPMSVPAVNPDLEHGGVR